MKNIVKSKDCLICRGCCYFENEEDAKLAPFFSEEELKKIGSKKKFLVKDKSGFLKAKTTRDKNGKGYFCIFLSQKDYKCRIYKNRPLDCETWPFVVGYDKDKKGVYLWVVNTNYCPSADIKKITKSKVKEIVSYLRRKNLLKEIENKERFIWPYQKYMLKLIKIK